jgi:DNA-binding beta-propeller fold protein YncE
MKFKAGLLCASILLTASTAAFAQIAVSANDGKQLRPGEAPTTRTADHVSVLDIRSYPPKIVGSVNAPASMIGAPAAVAVARDASFALVTAIQRLNAAGELEPAGVVSLIDLANPAAPVVASTAQVPPGAGGVTVNRAGNLAIVTSNTDDSVSVFTIANKRLTPTGKLQLPKGTRPTDVVFTPDNRSAMVVGQGSGKLIRLPVNGSTVTVGASVADLGVQPYGVVFSPDGRFAYNTNLGGRRRAEGVAALPGPNIGTVSAVNLSNGDVEHYDVGQTPETATLSRDGKFLGVVVHNGSSGAANSPGYNYYGLLKVYAVDGTSLSLVDETPTSPWCQGLVFTQDGGALLLQCAMTKQIEVYRFDGKTLTQDVGASLTLTARGGSIATPTSR